MKVYRFLKKISNNTILCRAKTDTNLLSNAFFPFRDGIDEAAKAGVTAIIQPGGSKRDEEVIVTANEHNLAMVFTSTRCFKH